MILIGVDSHSQTHTAYSVTESGKPCRILEVSNDPTGYQALLAWARQQSPGRVWGIENSGSYGRLLAQYLIRAGERVYEVNPQLTARWRRSQSARSKTDRHDALAIARVVVMESERLPLVVAEGQTDLLRVLIEQRDNVVQARTRTINQLHAQLKQLQPDYQTHCPNLRTPGAWTWCRRLSSTDPIESARLLVVQQLVDQIELYTEQIGELVNRIEAHVEQSQTVLQSLPGVGSIVAAMLLAYIGPIELFPSAAHLASYSATAPWECSSAGFIQHRVHRGGHRQLNRAFHILAMVQRREDPIARAYVEKKLAEGKTRREALRCLKRRLVKIVYAMLRDQKPYRYPRAA